VPDLAAAYSETRDRLVELVRPLDEPGLAAIVPATPEWTIKDVIAHLTHVAGAYANGHHSYSTQDANQFAIALSDDLPDIDRWAQDGVDERRARPLGTIIAEWSEETRDAGGESYVGKPGTIRAGTQNRSRRPKTFRQGDVVSVGFQYRPTSRGGGI
jgi:hypothetical protein